MASDRNELLSVAQVLSMLGDMSPRTFCRWREIGKPPEALRLCRRTSGNCPAALHQQIPSPSVQQAVCGPPLQPGACPPYVRDQSPGRTHGRKLRRFAPWTRTCDRL